MSNISRREFLKKVYNAMVLAGVSSFFSFDDLLAFDSGKYKKPNVVWLHGSSCSGCSTSMVTVDDINLNDIMLSFANFILHPTISAATGDDVINIMQTAIDKMKGEYIFVLEGSVPTAMPHACMFGGKPIMQWIKPLMQNASAVVAVGTCAAFGGVTTMEAMITGCQSADGFLKEHNISKPLINLPNCPLKPEHLVYVLGHLAKLGTAPKLDSKYRPLEFYAHTVHERCIYYSSFQEKIYAKKIGEDGCLFKLGCQGPVTKNDCLINGSNGNTNTCIRAGHPCIGCASEHFPRQIMMHSFDDPRAIKNFRVKG
jgi:hydrogenase small subunit